jgi:hypothetical protein
MSAADKAKAWKQFDAVMASSDREQRGASRGGQAPSRQGHGGGHKPYHNPFFDRNRDEGRQPQHRQHHTQHRPHQRPHQQHRKPYDRRPFNRQATPRPFPQRPSQPLWESFCQGHRTTADVEWRKSFDAYVNAGTWSRPWTPLEISFGGRMEFDGKWQAYEDPILSDLFNASASPWNPPSSPCQTSPTYTPSSPTYSPSSPTYTPSSPTYSPSSPTYTPSSPTYSPYSPPYLPTSPSTTATIALKKDDQVSITDGQHQGLTGVVRFVEPKESQVVLRLSTGLLAVVKLDQVKL